MNRRKLRLLLFTVCFIGAGCAVRGEPFARVEVPKSSAVIYVYRPYSFAGSLLTPEVTCGDQMFRLGPGGYHVFVVPASPTQCSVNGHESSDVVAVDASPRVHYLREEIGWGVFSGHPHLDPIDADQANNEIQQCCSEQR